MHFCVELWNPIQFSCFDCTLHKIFMFCTKVCCTQWDSSDDTTYLQFFLIALPTYRLYWYIQTELQTNIIVGVQCIQWIWLFWSQEYTVVRNYLNSDHRNIQLSRTISILQFPLIQFSSFHFHHWLSSKSVLDNISVSLWFQKQ